MKKLTSRKFLACVVGIISGLALCFGADANIVTEIGGITATVFSIVSYIIVEGNIDAAAYIAKNTWNGLLNKRAISLTNQ